MKYFVQPVIESLINTNAKTATKFVSPKEIIRATIHGKHRKGSNYEIVLTIGRPNYAERKFIKDCKKAGEPFPIKRVQLKFPPKKR